MRRAIPARRVLGVTELAQRESRYAPESYLFGTAPNAFLRRVVSIEGKYQLTVRDDRGFNDNVELHQGPVINPTGLTLQPGMSVTIVGYNRGRAFAANEVDTPYQAYGVIPVYPWGYAPSIGIGFGPVYFHHWH